MQRYSDPARVIRVKADEAFAIELEGNPTTGYTWQAAVDDQHLSLIGQEFKQRGGGVGAGGYEVCRFLALDLGETEISLVYQRPWEERLGRPSVSGS